MRIHDFEWLEKAREEIAEETKDMTIEEEVAYWREETEKLRARQKELQRESEKQRKAS